MNKKAELITGTILLLILISGIILYEINLNNKSYVADTKSGFFYNLKSNNTNCGVNNIVLDNKNIKMFSSEEEAKNDGFIQDINCS